MVWIPLALSGDKAGALVWVPLALLGGKAGASVWVPDSIMLALTWVLLLLTC